MTRVTPLALLLAFALLFGAVAPSPASAAKNETVVFVNGTKVKYAQAPVVREGVTLVSARETIEAVGLIFNWDQANRRIICTSKNGETTLSIVVNQLTATVNGVSVVLGAPAQEINGRIMVPLRFLTDSLGATLASAGGQIKITTNQPSKGPYYTGLPLEITNTYVRNRSQQPLTIVYEDFAADDEYYYTLERTLRVESGQKGVFELSSLVPGQTFTEDYEEYTFLGRAIVSAVSGDGEPVESKSYASVKKRHDTGAFVKQLKEQLDKLYEKQLQAFRQTLKQQLAANNGVPLKVEGTYIDYDMIDQPYANFQFINLTEKRIIAFEFTFDCYDAYGQKVKGTFSGNHRINANVGQTDLSPGQGSTYTTDLMWYERTHTLRNILVNKVAYSDGTVWKRK